MAYEINSSLPISCSTIISYDYYLFGTPDGNRTHNGPLGGDCYIHLTTEAYMCAFRTAEIIAFFTVISNELPSV